MNQVATRSEFEKAGLDGLDKKTAGMIPISGASGGVSFSSAMEVMEFAKLMALSQSAIRKDFRGNPGLCLAVVFKSIGWKMDPFEVASKSYIVNDQLAHESQLIHAIIEARAPLQHRLDCEYLGEGPERQCKVIGTFTNGDVREYTSPKIKDIRVKNSPLWKDDPDQQLWYYASRSWARKWCPDVIMGIYTRDEVEAGMGRDPEVIEGVGLNKRLAGSTHDRSEGHSADHIASELDQVAGGAVVTNTEEQVIIPPNGPLSIVCPSCGVLAGRPCITRGKPREEPHKERVKRAEEIDREKNREEPTDESDKGGTQESEQDQGETLEELPVPKTAAQWPAYVERWLILSEDPVAIAARWKSEMKMRNDLGITSEMRAPVEAKKTQRIEMLS